MSLHGDQRARCRSRWWEAPRTARATVRVALASPSTKDTPVRDGGDGGAGALSTRVLPRAPDPDGVITTWHFPRKMPGDNRRQLPLDRLRDARSSSIEPPPPRRGSAPRRTRQGSSPPSTRSRGRPSRATASRRRSFVMTICADRRGSSGLRRRQIFDVTGKSRVLVDATCGWPSSIDGHGHDRQPQGGGKLAMASLTRARLVSSGEAREHRQLPEAAQASFDPDPDALAEDAALAQQGRRRPRQRRDNRVARHPTEAAKGPQRGKPLRRAPRRAPPTRIRRASQESRSDCSIPRRRRRPRARSRPRSARRAARRHKALAEAVANPSDARVGEAGRRDLARSHGEPVGRGEASLKTQERAARRARHVRDPRAPATWRISSARKGRAPPTSSTISSRLGAATTLRSEVALLDALGNARGRSGAARREGEPRRSRCERAGPRPTSARFLKNRRGGRLARRGGVEPGSPAPRGRVPPWPSVT